MTITAPEIAAINSANAAATAAAKAPNDPSTAPVLAGLATATAAAALLKPTPIPTLTVKATGPASATVYWTNVPGGPTQIGRDGTDDTGYGPWNTGPITGQPTSGSYVFQHLVPGQNPPTGYTYTLLFTGGSMTVSLLQPNVVPPTGKIVFYRYNNGTLTASAMASAGVKVTGYSDYCNPTTNYTTYDAASCQAATKAGQKLVLGVGACTFAQAAAIAQILIANGQAAAELRIMWEGNQKYWFGQWNQVRFPTAAAQAAAFKTVVDGLFSVPGANFTIGCNLNIDANNANCAAGRTDFDYFEILRGMTQANGRPYVNVLGIDGYDNLGAFNNDMNDWNAFFAEAVKFGEQVVAYEWGPDLNSDPGGALAYVQGMTTLFSQHGVIAQGLFSYNAGKGGIDSDMTDPACASALATFIAWAKKQQ